MSHFTRDQREKWAAATRDSPFNLWLKRRTTDADGLLDLSKLAAVAEEYGVNAARYKHLNAGQQRMNIGNRLRRIVPDEVYAVGLRDCSNQTTPAAAATQPKASQQATWFPFAHRTVPALLQLQAAMIDELRRRGIVRTGNAPLGDYAEALFTKAFGWRMAPNSAKSVNAVDERGCRFQIKARRLRAGTAGERQLGILRRLEEDGFDQLAAVLFHPDFSVARAALIPRDIVLARATYMKHVNGWRFIFDNEALALNGARDVTPQLQQAALALR